MRDVVDDPDGELALRPVAGQLVEDGLDHRRRELLGRRGRSARRSPSARLERRRVASSPRRATVTTSWKSGSPTAPGSLVRSSTAIDADGRRQRRDQRSAGNGRNSRILSSPTCSPAAEHLDASPRRRRRPSPSSPGPARLPGHRRSRPGRSAGPVRAASSSMTCCDDARARRRRTGSHASRAWKNTSGFWAVPRSTGRVGRQAPRRGRRATSSSSTSARRSSSVEHARSC